MDEKPSLPPLSPPPEKLDAPSISSLPLAETNVTLNRAVNRKFDLHILPWLFGIWLLSFIDRSNIGNAKLAGLPEDLHISTGTSFNVALLVFYIPYILIDVPSNLLLKKFKAGIYLPSLITAWGVVCTCIGFTKSFAGLVVCRLLLGLFEGGILGGVIIYLAMFYTRHQVLYRSGLFYSAAPLSGAFGGLLASALGQIEYRGYRRWPWIFFSKYLPVVGGWGNVGGGHMLTWGS